MQGGTQRFGRGNARLLTHAKGLRNRGDHQCRIGDRSEVNEPNAMWKGVVQGTGDLERQASLANATRSCQREQPHVGRSQARANRSDLPLPTDK